MDIAKAYYHTLLKEESLTKMISSSTSPSGHVGAVGCVLCYERPHAQTSPTMSNKHRSSPNYIMYC
jgi:hypothetical protein